MVIRSKSMAPEERMRVEYRGAAAVVPGQGGLGENEVQPGQKLHVDGQVLAVRSGLVA